MRALITGAGGFCGKRMSSYLAEQGVEVYSLGSKDNQIPNHHCLRDISSASEIVGILNKIRPDYVFHIAGIMQSNDPAQFYQINTVYGITLITAMETAGLSDTPVLLVGTSAEYGMVTNGELPITEDLCPKPYNHYGISKLALTLAGLAASKRGVACIMARPFNIIGPGMPGHLVIQSFAEQIDKIIKQQSPPVIKVGNIKTSRDFIDVEDVVKTYWNLVRNTQARGEIVNICSGRRIPIEDILKKLIALSGVSVEILTEPSRLKSIDVPIHFGSDEKMKKLSNHSLEINLDRSLSRILNHLKTS